MWERFDAKVKRISSKQSSFSCTYGEVDNTTSHLLCVLCHVVPYSLIQYQLGLSETRALHKKKLVVYCGLHGANIENKSNLYKNGLVFERNQVWFECLKHRMGTITSNSSFTEGGILFLIFF